MARITFDKWVRTYKPIRHSRRKSTPFSGCLYDAWSEKEKLEAFRHCVANPKRIWTFMEMDGRLFIVAGWGLVNRLGYFVCSEVFENEWDAPEVPLGRF